MIDWIIGGAIALAAVLAGRHVWKKFKSGGCAGGCAGCSGCCHPEPHDQEGQNT